MNFIEIFKKRRTLIYLKIVRAGINPGDLVLSAKVRNFFADLKAAFKNWKLYRSIGIIEVMRPQDIYTHYCRPEEAVTWPYFGEAEAAALREINTPNNTGGHWDGDADLEGRLTTGCDFPS